MPSLGLTIFGSFLLFLLEIYATLLIITFSRPRRYVRYSKILPLHLKLFAGAVVVAIIFILIVLRTYSLFWDKAYHDRYADPIECRGSCGSVLKMWSEVRKEVIEDKSLSYEKSLSISTWLLDEYFKEIKRLQSSPSCSPCAAIVLEITALTYQKKEEFLSIHVTSKADRDTAKYWIKIAAILVIFSLPLGIIVTRAFEEV
jgi:hypothetical protein